MKKIIAILFLGLALTGCNEKIEKGEAGVIVGKHYFDFDEVIHYKIDIEEDSVYKSMQKHGDLKYKSERDSLISTIMIDDAPYKLTDTTFETNIKRIGFTSKKINKSKLAALNEIFRERKYDDYTFTACLNVYRVILVFKRQSRTVGIAKICFGCGGLMLVGANDTTDEFMEYAELHKLLKE